MQTAQEAEPSTTAVWTEEPEPAEAAAPAAAPAPAPASPSVGVRGLEFTTLDDMWKFASFAHKAGWSPKNATPESNVVAMQFGAELGVNAMQAIQNITPINGRPCAWGDLPLGLCMNSPYFDHAAFREWTTGTPGKDDYTAHCEARRHGGNVTEATFSVEDAKRAGLWEGAHQVGQRQTPKDTIWYKYFKRMLKYRARTFCLRDTFPDVLKGLHTGEEMSDVDAIMSRLDLGKRSEPATTEAPDDLRKRLTKPDKAKKPAKKPKPEAAAPPSEPRADEAEDDPELLRVTAKYKCNMIAAVDLSGAFATAGITKKSDLDGIDDCARLREINRVFARYVPEEAAK